MNLWKSKVPQNDPNIIIEDRAPTDKDLASYGKIWVYKMFPYHRSPVALYFRFGERWLCYSNEEFVQERLHDLESATSRQSMKRTWEHGVWHDINKVSPPLNTTLLILAKDEKTPCRGYFSSLDGERITICLYHCANQNYCSTQKEITHWMIVEKNPYVKEERGFR